MTELSSTQSDPWTPCQSRPRAACQEGAPAGIVALPRLFSRYAFLRRAATLWAETAFEACEPVPANDFEFKSQPERAESLDVVVEVKFGSVRALRKPQHVVGVVICGGTTSCGRPCEVREDCERFERPLLPTLLPDVVVLGDRPSLLYLQESSVSGWESTRIQPPTWSRQLARVAPQVAAALLDWGGLHPSPC